MKKSALLLIVSLLLPIVSHSEISLLKLRASRHSDSIRIVVEGAASVITKGLVYQRGESILVSFPDSNFSIETEQSMVVYKRIGQYTVMLFPGEFRGLKVFTLKSPARLVIDVHLKDGEAKSVPPVPAQREKRKKGLFRIETVVIDAGHGGYESGIVRNGNKEKNAVLDIAKKLRALVDSSSAKSFLTRGSDRFMSMKERVKNTNNREADVFISIHIGNHSNIVIYVPVITERVSEAVKPYLENTGQADYREETRTLVRAMKTAFISSFGKDMVSVQPIPYSIISRTEAASVMVELPSFDDADYIEELNAEMASTFFKGLYIYEEIKVN